MFASGQNHLYAFGLSACGTTTPRLGITRGSAIADRYHVTIISLLRRLSKQTGRTREKCCIVPINKFEAQSSRVNLPRVNRTRTNDVASMLRRRIQWGVHLGLVKVGDRLPSLRAASAEFGVDQRSVLNAYRDLEREGIVEMRPRSGIYVAAESQPAAQLPPSGRWMSEMFLQGFARGVNPVSLGPTLASAINAAPLTAACIECNGDQILWMAAQLREEFGLATVWIEPDMPQGEITERIRACDLIVTTTFHAQEARKLGDQFQKPVVVATAGRDGVTQVRAELGRGPVYFIGTDERYAKKLLDASDSARWMSNLRPIIVDRATNVVEVPAGSPVYVTQAAANILGESTPAGAEVLDSPFSSESRMEIIAIILAAALKASAGKLPSADLATR